MRFLILVIMFSFLFSCEKEKLIEPVIETNFIQLQDEERVLIDLVQIENKEYLGVQSRVLTCYSKQDYKFTLWISDSLLTSNIDVIRSRGLQGHLNSHLGFKFENLNRPDLTICLDYMPFHGVFKYLDEYSHFTFNGIAVDTACIERIDLMIDISLPTN